MKTRQLIITLALILCAATAWEVRPGFGWQLVAGGGAVDPCAGTLICEGFEGTGAPSGWATPDSAPNIDWDYATSPAPLEGEQSLMLDSIAKGSMVRLDTPSFTITGNILVVSFRLLPLAVNSVSDVSIALRNSSFVTVGTMIIGTNGSLCASVPGGTWSCSSGGKVVADTEVYLKLVHVTGTGGDSAMYIYTSQDGATWTLADDSTGGTNTTKPANFRFEAMGNAEKFIFDRFVVSE